MKGDVVFGVIEVVGMERSCEGGFFFFFIVIDLSLVFYLFNLII